MTLAQGREYLAIPGPSVIPDRVLRAMHRASPNIYAGELVDMVAGLTPDLKALARTRHDVAMYIANGHGAWEAALANTVTEGDRVLVLSTGRFAEGWGEVARILGADVQTLDFGKRAPVDPQQLEEALREEGARGIAAVLCVQVDTASSVRNDIPAIRAALDAAGHDALLMVDCIASFGCETFEMDAWGVDVMVTGSQKGLMTPPGMGFVFFNDKAARRGHDIRVASKYWDWQLRARPEVFYEYFGGTAPTHHIYGLREALDMIAEEGVEKVWARHATLARAIWAAAEVWGQTAGQGAGQNGAMELNIAEPACRSHAVTALRLGAPNGTALRDWLSDRTGVTLGIGLGMAAPGDPAWHGFFRIGHMGHVNAHMIMGVLGTIDAGLKALAVDHGAGALDAASAVVATA
ncbi:pyridoxal-phosphate-dependent aminotransferase family protein [Brevirhabdus sp.]|uniref:pyridoxal-phosphate-dependent aminotransferase family protein n=1 Tax=Brevirhabdus sp. TaxID=2004514 RepID=UPI00405A3374